MSALLEIQDLHVSFLRDKEYSEVVHGISLSLQRGRTLGIVGESGSGKSVSSMAVMGLLPASTSRLSGSIRFDGVELLSASEAQLRAIRGSRISMIFQEPMTALNPVQKCGAQVVEMLRQHENVSKREARQRVLSLFEEVLLPRPEKIFDSYPHEISGGQKQRVIIAMALICNPDIVIADEPTTALDVTVQKTILDLLRRLQQTRGISIIFITHDLGVIAQIADEVAVMYRGDIVEYGTADQILRHPAHQYTKGLLACRPPLDSRPMRLPTVQDFLSGTDIDSKQQPPFDFDSAAPLLSVRDFGVTYTLKKNLLGKPLQTLQAVDHISFEVYRGETLGLVGESGCGKTTLGRALLQLISASSGTVAYAGQRLDQMDPRQLRQFRTKLQIIFQDPYSSLNPRITVGDAIMEPLKVHRLLDNDAQRREYVLHIMSKVGLQADWYQRYPHEFSGGQRQRVCIARALALRPELVVCDESVSALDVSVQAQVLNLLNDLKREFGFTYIFITHDLSVVKFLSDRIMVMQQGRMVELDTADSLFAHPQSAYTQHLLDAIPKI